MIRSCLLAMTLVGALAVGFGASTGCSHAESGSGGGAATAHADDRVYICPMRCVQPGHTEPYTQHGPGDCPVCGMHLVVKPEETAPPSGGGH